MQNTAIDLQRLRGRLITSISLLLILALLVGAYGLVSHNPTLNSYADEDTWGTDPASYLGDPVSANGIIVETDPYVIKVSYGIENTMQLTIENVESDIAKGTELGVFGTLADERTIVANRTHLRYPWEAQYMYGISLLGGLWVLARVLNQWTIQTTPLSLVPRNETDD